MLINNFKFQKIALLPVFNRNEKNFQHSLINIYRSVTVAVNIHNGRNLTITKISRTDMGAYLCIATNGVPPSVSKRIIVDVECK